MRVAAVRHLFLNSAVGGGELRVYRIILLYSAACQNVTKHRQVEGKPASVTKTSFKILYKGH
jgi:hypothetical protein